MSQWESKEPCLVSGAVPCEYHHLYTRKAHPELQFKAWNSMPLHRAAHTEFHVRGAKYMANKYPRIRRWLEKNDWTFDEHLDRWTHRY